jgi:hypothetical protein
LPRVRSLLVSVLQWGLPGVAAGVGAADGAAATSTSTGTTVSTATLISTTSAAIAPVIPPQGIQVTNGNTTRSTAGALHIRTEQRPINSAAPRVAIRWLTARQERGNRSAGRAAISAAQIEAGWATEAVLATEAVSVIAEVLEIAEELEIEAAWATAEVPETVEVSAIVGA